MVLAPNIKNAFMKSKTQPDPNQFINSQVMQSATYKPTNAPAVTPATTTNKFTFSPMQPDYERDVLSPKSATFAAANPPTAQTNAPIDPNAQLREYMKTYLEKSQKPITPFQYDPNTDQSFQAERAIVNEDLRKAMANARVNAGASGMRGGSLQNNQLSQLSQQAESRLQNEALPAAFARKYQEYQDQQTQSRNQNQDLLGFINTQSGLNQTDVTNQRNARLDAESIKQNEIANALAKRQSNLSAASTVGNQLGRVIQPKDDWSNLYNQEDAPLNIESQTQAFNQNLQARDQDLQETQVMAQLMGTLPDGTPTTAEQQRLLANEWNRAEQLGTIGERLGELYGLPANTPTQSAKMQAAQLAISQQNANTSASSAANSAANSSRSAANQEESQRLNRERFEWEKNPNNPDNIYKAAQAADKSQPPKTSYKDNTEFQNEVTQIMQNPMIAMDILRKNATAYIDKYGLDGYKELISLSQK